MNKTAFIAAFSFLTFIACQQKNGSTDNTAATDSIALNTETTAPVAADTFPVKRIELIDSISPKTGFDLSDPEIGPENLHYSFAADWPTDNSILADSIRAWIISNMGDKYNNETSDIEKLFHLYAQDFYKETERWNGCTTEINISKAYENDKIVTYTADSYYYLGGAHGGGFYSGTSFCKETGKILGWSIFKSPQEIKDKILEKMPEYFDVKTTEEALEMMILNDTFPLPTTEPWIINDSIFFIYQSYEIACYAAGRPNCVFAMDELKDYLKK